MRLFSQLTRALPLFALCLLTSPALAGDVTLQAADGVSLHAQSFGGGEHGVVLVHGAKRSSQDWTLFADKLSAGGFRVIAVDLRGHGASTTPEDLGDGDWPKMVQDVASAVQWLRSQGVDHIALVGAEAGANLAAQAAAADEDVQRLVLLSPGMNLNGLMPKQAVIDYGDRPLFIVASAEDTYGAKSARFLEAQATGEVKVQILDGSAKGTRMLSREPGLDTRIATWLQGTEEGSTDAQRREVTTGSSSEIETSGKKFGE